MDDRKKARRRFEQVNLLCDQVIRNLPTPTHALWLLVAWRHADVSRKFRKSTNEMARQVGITKRHAQRIVDDLLKVGAIEITTPRQGTIPTVYKITGKPRGDIHVTTKE